MSATASQYKEMEGLQQSASIRLLEIDAELKEMKRVYLLEGKSGDHGRRATLEAEYAQLMLERARRKAVMQTMRKEQDRDRQALFVVTLTGLLKDLEMHEVIRQADRIAAQKMAETEKT